MAKFKPSRQMIYGAVAVLGIGGFLLTQPEAVTRKGAPKRNSRGTSSAPTTEGITEEDRTAKFARVSSPARNVFQPLVSKATTGNQANRSPNEFPLSLTGGTTPWYFTGTAIVNQVPRALVENTSTGEAIFVGVGDTVGLARIVQVGPSFLVASGKSGPGVRLDLLADVAPDEPDGPAPIPGSFAPVTPTLNGPIVGSRNPGSGNSSPSSTGNRITSETPNARTSQ